MLPLADSCIHFINNFVYTYNPNLKGDKIIPFVLWPRQVEFINWLFDMHKTQKDAVIDKCRDMGATWLFIAFSVWLMLFHKQESICFFTFKAARCDTSGDISTLFGKANLLLDYLPPLFKEGVTSKQMHIKNFENNSDIVGSAGDYPGTGDRRSIVFKDESARYQHSESIDQSLSQTSKCKIDVSTHYGTNTLFYRKCISGEYPIFTFDWWENPNHTQEWYESEKRKAESTGTLHIFKSEVERNPQASVESVICPAEWVISATKHEVSNTGKIVFALDVSDGGEDTNALVGMNGNDLIYIDEWSTNDPNVTARKAFFTALECNASEIRYDNIGVGSGVKSGFNSIIETLKEKPELYEKALKIKIIGWSAAGGVIRPDDKDCQDKPNNELFENAKSQAYWRIRVEFLHTYYMTMNEKYDKDKIINFAKAKNNKLFVKLCNEISQPQMGLTRTGKIIIDKKPNGMKSPNLAEAYMIARAELEFIGSVWD